jgi:tetratricopeptide (TPR) repeat protein
MESKNRRSKWRLAVLLLLFLLCLGGSLYTYRVLLNAALVTPTPAAKDLTGPALPRGSTIFLTANQVDVPFRFRGNLAKELFRQGLLIAAREQMGLQTRDASLREWHDDPPPGDALAMDFKDPDVVLRDVQQPGYVRMHLVYDEKTWPADLDALTDVAEAMSRKEFVSALQGAGWTGNPIAIKADAPAPADAQQRLDDMEELSQFGLLRETHAAIKTDGESPARLETLILAYANLGQLTRYHWSMEYAVYTARSLLYAQRLVVEQPNSARALWDRAYARAMAGMMGDASKDLEAAKQLPAETAPKWVALLEPLCDYKTGKLVDLATADPALSHLGMFMAFLSVENSGSQGAIMNFAQAAFTVNPSCQRLIDAMCDQTGPGMLNQLSYEGAQVFSPLLVQRLEAMPAFPQDMTGQIEGFTKPGGNPKGDAREIICQELIRRGSPQTDSVEPSWAALGRMVQETTFVHVFRQSNLISQERGVDASDYVSQARASVMDHPYKYFIDALGMAYYNTPNAKGVGLALMEPKFVLATCTRRQLPVYTVERGYQSDGGPSPDQFWQQIIRNSDYDATDIEGLIYWARGEDVNPWVTDELTHLRKVSPQSPTLQAFDIAAGFNAAKAAQYEAQHGDYPTVSIALGLAYYHQHRWADAERCFRKYIAVSPDQVGYEDLANVFKDQKKDDKWLATLNDYLNHGVDYGLQASQVQEQIAGYYMDHHDFRSAVPYADAAEETASAGGMFTAAQAHSGIGDFSTAEQMFKEEMSHYSETPLNWFCWCSRTGHGDLASARQALMDYYAGQAKLDSDQLMIMGDIQLSQNQLIDALATYKRRMKEGPGPVSAMYIACIEDELHNTTARNAALDQVSVLPRTNAPLCDFMALYRTALESNSPDGPDAKAVEKLMKGQADIDQQVMLGLMGRYLLDRGQTARAISYLKRLTIYFDYPRERIWADPVMRANGVDPWKTDKYGT